AAVTDENGLDEPRLRPFRKRLLEKLLAYDREFVERRGEDPTMLAELATSHLRVASISSRAGANEEALAASQKGIAIRRKLIERSPDDFQLRADLANT